MSAAACKIDEFKSACEIHKCTSRADILEPGQSPSQPLVLYLDRGTSYNGHLIDKCFVKFWIETGNISDIIQNYEAWVYANCTRQLVDYNVCPNFVLYYARGKGCTFNDIHQITKGYQEDQLVQLLEQLDKKSYERHDEIKGEDSPVRNAINLRDLRYSMLVTESIQGDTFLTYMQNHGLDPEFWNILLQVAIGCYALVLSRTVHNDLHPNNIILVDTNEIITYKVNDKHYTINVTHKVKIFDFDRAYAERQGKQPWCDAGTIMRDGVAQGLDITDIISFVYKIYSDDVVLDLIRRNNNVYQFRDVFINTDLGGGSQHPESLLLKPIEWFDQNIRELPDIIDRIAQKVQLLQGVAQRVVYNCSRDRFYPNGVLKLTDELPQLSMDDLLEQSAQVQAEMVRLKKSQETTQELIARLQVAKTDLQRALTELHQKISDLNTGA
jgi:hypothetical protein